MRLVAGFASVAHGGAWYQSSVSSPPKPKLERNIGSRDPDHDFTLVSHGIGELDITTNPRQPQSALPIPLLPQSSLALHETCSQRY